MILMLDSSTGTCRLTLIDGNTRHDYEWQADRQLAKGLLGFIDQTLAEHNLKFDDVGGLAVMKGPGSFTGLRIGITVMNTLASSLSVPIVSAVGKDWHEQSLQRLNDGQNEQLVMPLYGAEANITTPRK